jgi:hypothetical protein
MLSEFFGGRIIVASWITGSIATGFLSLGVFEGERVQKQPEHIRRIETKYLAVHFKRHCRNFSPGCIRHEEKSESLHR